MKGKLRIGCGLGVVLLFVACLATSCGAEPVETSGTSPSPGAGSSSSTGSSLDANLSPGAGPLLSLLTGIPEDPISEADDFVYFVDYSAMESVYDAVRPTDAEEFAALSESDVAHNVWWVLFRGSAWSISDYWLVWLEGGPQMVGFSPLEVDRAIQFGVPPGYGLMLEGSFDADAVSTAYQANFDLSAKDFDGTTVWLWGDDPADGLMTNVSQVARENPFGGYLGRRQPMIISDDLLMSSADLGLVLAHAAALEGAVPDLADAAGYSAAVNAISEDADLLQAAIAGPTMALNVAYQPLDTHLAPAEMPNSTSEASPDDQEELPAYQLLILADVVTSDEQIARLGLVYQDGGSAETAAAILVERLATYPSVSGRSFAEVLTPSDGTGTRYYVRPEADQTVLVLEFPAPKATSEEIVGMLNMTGYDGTATTPGFIYRRLLTMFAQRDTSWLSVAARAE